MSYDDIVYQITAYNPKAKFADGLEEGLVGYAWVKGKVVALYSTQKVIDILMKRDEMDEDEAREFFEFNIAGSYIGPDTPIFHYFQWEREDL